jgi:hypothetical protein
MESGTSTKDLKAKFEKEAVKRGAEPAPDTTAGKKAFFEAAIKNAAPKDPKPKVRFESKYIIFTL